MELIDSALSSGTTGIAIPDSTGIADAETIHNLISSVRAKSRDIDVIAHYHNDFALAVANTLEAVKSGANVIESSLGGLWRKSNIATEEIGFTLQSLYRLDLGLDLKKLADAGKLAYQLSRSEIPPMKPIIGSYIFAQKIEFMS
ncbi:MAG: hypothetical protein PXY39_07660 [archaeon]|nr:hypothetical protein [archaeon]